MSVGLEIECAYRLFRACKDSTSYVLSFTEKANEVVLDGYSVVFDGRKEFLLIDAVKFLSAFLEYNSHVSSQLTSSCLMQYKHATIISDRVNREDTIINHLLFKSGCVFIRH